MGEYLKSELNGKVTLPMPISKKTSFSREIISTGKLRDVQCLRLELEEKESIASILFPG